MKKVLVTGGAGFIGSTLVDVLIGRGYKVKVLDNLSYGNREWVNPKAEFIYGDIADLEMCRYAMSGVHGVFHMAAMSRSGPSDTLLFDCTNSNIVGTQNILVASRENNIRKLVYSGSSTFYGNLAPPHLESIKNPDLMNFYGLSKFVGEEYVRMYEKVFGLKAVILRYFNVYGQRQPRVGAYALVLGIFLDRLAKRLPLEVHGDGSQRRDFIHVLDVVEANILALESDISNVTYNVGSGENYSILEIAKIISNNIVFTPKRQGDSLETLADIDLIKKDLGWKPQVSFSEALTNMVSEVRCGN